MLYISIAVEIGKANVQIIIGLFFHKLNIKSTEANAGRTENTLFHVNTAETTLNTKKSHSHALFFAHAFSRCIKTPSRIIPIPAIAAPENAPKQT